MRTKKQWYQLKPTDFTVLEAVYKFRFMMTEHIRQYLGQSVNSLPKLRQRLCILAGENDIIPSENFLQRFYQLRETPLVNLPFVHALANPGKKELARRGYDVALYEKQGKIQTQLPYELEHHFTINQVLLSALRLPQVEPRIEVFEFQHDFMLKHHPEKFQVSVSKGASSTLLASPVLLHLDILPLQVRLSLSLVV